MNTIKKLGTLLMVLLLSTFGVFAQTKNATSGNIGFFSSTPVEDIKANSKSMKAAINPQSKKVAFMVQNTSFEFENKLMQEHFNEKYMESDKYKLSSFSGDIIETIDWTKDGEHTINAKGKLNIHGVEQERTITAKVVIKDGKINLTSNFKVKVADHKIEIPKLVTSKIAEEIEVKVEGTF